MKVVSKKVIKLDKPIKVYDLTVPKYHNFSLANGCIVHNCVEGDSAGGGVRQARDKSTQMVLALKGKPLNAMKTDDAKVLASEEVANILSSIGYNPALKEPTSKLSCGKIILMSDADDDGFHINALVISLLYKYLPDLFEKGIVYTLDSANCKYYAMDTKDNYYFGKTVEDVKEKIVKAKAKINGKVSYLKGWGELDPKGLRISAMDVNTRNLIKLNPLTSKGYDKLVALMGEDSTMRKELLGV